jgi:NADH dehydrogenase
MALQKSDKLVTVFGASGFLGRYVVQELCRRGLRVRAVCRNTQRALFLKPLGGLGQVQIVGADITRPASLAAAVAGSYAVINLVGILKGNFAAVQADGAAALANAAQEAGVDAFVHVSAIGADPHSRSRYGRTKGEGEAAVKAAFPKATIIRPSVIFGPEDDFINRFARMVSLLPVVPVIRPEARFQPVWVGDVAAAIALAAAEPRTYGGKTFELGGARSYSFSELIGWISATIRCNRTLLPLPDSVAEMIAAFDFLPGAPITRDQWLMLQHDNVVTKGVKGLEAFGITPVPLETKAPEWLVRYRKHGRFNIDKASLAR